MNEHEKDLIKNTKIKTTQTIIERLHQLITDYFDDGLETDSVFCEALTEYIYELEEKIEND